MTRFTTPIKEEWKDGMERCEGGGTADQLQTLATHAGAVPDPAGIRHERKCAAQEPMRYSGGVAVPQGPGLGMAIDREVLQQYCEPPPAHYDKKPEEIPHQRATRGMLPAPQRQQSTRSL